MENTKFNEKIIIEDSTLFLPESKVEDAERIIKQRMPPDVYQQYCKDPEEVKRLIRVIALMPQKQVTALINDLESRATISNS